MGSSFFATRWWLTLVIGALGGTVATQLGLPLPWLNGALLAVGLTRLVGLVGGDIPGGRQFGLWIIATGIGLHFNAAVVAAIVAQGALIALGVGLTLSMGLIGIGVLRWAGYDAKTAYFASIPGGASEMVLLAGARGARQDLVALAHSLRITLIVLTIPAFCFALVPSGTLVAAVPVVPTVLWIVLPAGLVAVWLAQRIGAASPWMLAPLLMVVGLTALGDFHSTLPDWLRNPAQLLIGCSLGCRFERSTLAHASRFACFSVLASLLGMVAAIALAFGLAWGFGLPVIPWMLGIMPGGIAELTLTAELVGHGVALVTALQVLRLIAVMLIADPLFQRWYKQQ